MRPLRSLKSIRQQDSSQIYRAEINSLIEGLEAEYLMIRMSL